MYMLSYFCSLFFSFFFIFFCIHMYLQHFQHLNISVPKCQKLHQSCNTIKNVKCQKFYTNSRIPFCLITEVFTKSKFYSTVYLTTHDTLPKTTSPKSHFAEKPPCRKDTSPKSLPNFGENAEKVQKRKKR